MAPMNFIALSCSHALSVSFPLFLSIARFSLLPLAPGWLATLSLSLSLSVVHTRVNAGTHAAADRCNAASSLCMWKCEALWLQIAGTGRWTDLLMARNQGAGAGGLGYPRSGKEDWRMIWGGEVMSASIQPVAPGLSLLRFTERWIHAGVSHMISICLRYYPQPWDGAGRLSGLEASRVTPQRLN